MNNAIIDSKLAISTNKKQSMFYYFSLGEIIGQNYLLGESDLNCELHEVRDPETYIKDMDMEQFSEHYLVGKGSIFYKRKHGLVTVKLFIRGIDTNNVEFFYNKGYYSLVRFKVDNMYPVGIHANDIMLSKLIEGGNLVVHGASIYNERTKKGFSLVAPPDTGKTYTTYKFMETDGYKFLGEDLSLRDSETNKLHCMPYTSTWGHRFSFTKIDLSKIPFLGLFMPQKKLSVYDIFGKDKVQDNADSNIIYLMEKSTGEKSIAEMPLSESNEIKRKVKIIQRNEFSYYKNALLYAYDYINDSGQEQLIKKENDLIDAYFNQNKVFIVQAPTYKEYYDLIKSHQDGMK